MNANMQASFEDCSRFAQQKKYCPQRSPRIELEAAKFFKIDISQFSAADIINKSPQVPFNQDSAILANFEDLVEDGKFGGVSRKRTTDPTLEGFNSFQTEKSYGACGIPAGISLNGRNSRRSIRMSMDKNHRSKSCSESTQHRIPRQKEILMNQRTVSATTISTNSLPSVSSSPSISPSLICPHLTLDDLLNWRSDFDTFSPHTIGLCFKCRFDPPLNVQSPLSPLLTPYKQNNFSGDELQFRKFKRGYSDNQSVSQKQKEQRAARAARKVVQSMRRDDSLDYFLDPKALRRMELPPAMKNSVEFIRRNSIESARIIRIYKNRFPHDKPLRICLLRNEFSSLDRLLDHINSRQLISGGARYLFHLDGQLVYSVQELKHGSIYIVSGEKKYDFRASFVLKEILKRERQQREQHLISWNDLSPNGAPHSSEQESIFKRYNSSDALIEITGQERSFDLGSKKLISPANISCEKEKKESVYRPVSIDHCDFSVKESIGAPDKHTSPEKSSSCISKSKSSHIRLTRAKSDLSIISGSKGKQRKMVTFREAEKETMEGPSTLKKAILGTPSDYELDSAEPAQVIDELNTNEIGFQVSDSIDGFLIDLPIELPARGDDSNIHRQACRHKRLSASSNFMQRRQINIPEGGKVLSASKIERYKANRETAKNVARRQIVTITERQLSVDELSQLRDLDHGDHHSKNSKVAKKLDFSYGVCIDESILKEQGIEENDQIMDKKVPDPNMTDIVVIGKDIKRGGINEDFDIKAQSIEPNIGAERFDNREGWQYPDYTERRMTPTSESIRQSDANDSVRAHVTTPTPSLSVSAEGVDRCSPRVKNGSHRKRFALTDPSEIVSNRRKQRVEVVGALHEGLFEPTKNFRLAWVNGFMINDRYPDNIFNIQQQRFIEQKHHEQQRAASSQRKVQINCEATSTSDLGLAQGFNSMIKSKNLNEDSFIQFKPSERFHNWICYSRIHDELIHPAGNLVVLWCFRTNEQRYYAKHDTNVSAVSLSTYDMELAASAQACDFSANSDSNKNIAKAPKVPAAKVHLWSLVTLQTLFTVEDDRLRMKRIFSLKLKNSKKIGCKLSLLARDNKKMQLIVFSGDHVLNQNSKNFHANLVEQQCPKPTKENKTMTEVGAQAGFTCSMGFCKNLRNNQLPFSLLSVIDELDNSIGSTNSSDGKSQATNKQRPSILITLGRNHFNVWLLDHQKREIRLSPIPSGIAHLEESITRANCATRLSPNEFLLGDHEGVIFLLKLDYRAMDRASGTLDTKSCADDKAGGNGKMSFEVVQLVKQGSQSAVESQTDRIEPNSAAITCLARISGNIFACADSFCTFKIYQIKRVKKPVDCIKTHDNSSGPVGGNEMIISCHLIKSICLPPDLGFICSIVLTNYKRRERFIDFFLICASNTILSGSLEFEPLKEAQRSTESVNKSDIYHMGSLTVVYEGHETAVASLSADAHHLKIENLDSEASKTKITLKSSIETNHYFTCSLDCRICKWDGKHLVWKSLLPSSCASLAIHPVGVVLAVGSIDGTVFILDKRTGLMISYFPLTPVCINCLSYSRDGSLLAAGCENGSIFILPTHDKGLKYSKVSIFQSPNPVVSLQFSVDSRYILTSVTRGSWQELLLWDLPNFRYMKDNVRSNADKIRWFDAICCGSEDVRAIWENTNLIDLNASKKGPRSHLGGLSKKTQAGLSFTDPEGLSQPLHSKNFVVNLSCHRLLNFGIDAWNPDEQRSEIALRDIEPSENNFVIASDTRGYLRLFRYPCYDIQQGFFAIRISSMPVNNCRFLPSSGENYFVSTALDGAICLWVLD